MPQQDNNFMSQFLGKDFSAYFTQAPGSQLDVSSLMETHRKNTQAATDAMKVAGEGMQAYAQRCTELMSQLMEDQSKLANELMSEGSPEEKISKQADLIQKSYDKSVGNVKELADLVSKSNQEAGELINKRVSASLNEIKGALSEKKSASASSSQKKAS